MDEIVQKYIRFDACVLMSPCQRVYDNYVNTKTHEEVEKEIKTIYANLGAAEQKKRDIDTKMTEVESQSKYVQSVIEAKKLKLLRLAESFRKIGRQMPRTWAVKVRKRIFKTQ